MSALAERIVNHASETATAEIRVKWKPRYKRFHPDRTNRDGGHGKCEAPLSPGLLSGRRILAAELLLLREDDKKIGQAR